jgi:hypothetical protein
MAIKRYQRTAISQYLIIGLVIISLVAMGFLNAYLMRRISYDDAFVVPWAAGRVWLLEGESPYGDSVSRAARSALANSPFDGQIPDSSPLMVPVFDLVLTIPFSLLPYEIARVVWMTLLEVVIGFVVYMGIKISGWKLSLLETIALIFLLVVWFPGAVTLFSGLKSPVTIGLILLGFYLVLKEQDTPAGFVLSLTSAAIPVSTLILLVVMIWALSRRRWSLIFSYFSGLAFLWIVSLLLLPGWPLDWLRVLVNTYDNWGWIQTPLMRLADLLPGISFYLNIFLHGFFGIYYIVVAITLWGKVGRVFTWKILAVFVLTLLFNVQASAPDLILLLPAVFLVFRFWTERWGGWGRVFSWILFLSMVAGSWYFALPVSSMADPVALSGLIIIVPLVTLVGLIWIRWWAINIPKLPFERR